MAPTNPPQRAWRAACPNCGAPVDFASAATPVAVCSFCRSTLARDGQALRRIGQQAELFEDYSPLQLGTAGQWQGMGFTLIGRLQLRYEGGSWNEWHALFASGKSGWLSEDNGRYVMAFEQPLPDPAQAPAPHSLQPGARVVLAGQPWQVGAITQAQVAAAQGELPAVPSTASAFTVVELRNAQGEVGTLDYGSPQAVHWSVGRSAALPDLKLTGLREASEKTLQARGLECPCCGTALEIKLSTTQSIVCHQCQAVVDVSQGVGGDLAHYAQDNAQPGGIQQLPLGATATLALGGPPQDWQVVGYVERCEIPDDPEDERVFWREYLLYARNTGFVFLVDAEDGWSWAAAITGAPVVRGDSARWQGTDYRKRFSYSGQITHVLGEFYWQLKRGERTNNTDYTSGNKRLNREQTGSEVTWSAGETVDAAVINKAFKLAPGTVASMAPEASPFSSKNSSSGGSFMSRLILGLVVLVLLLILIRSCSSDGCDDVANTFGRASNEYQQCRNHTGGVARAPRTGGGSFGGYGSGGGHK